MYLERLGLKMIAELTIRTKNKEFEKKMREQPRCGSMVVSHGSRPQERGGSSSANGGLCRSGNVPLGHYTTWSVMRMSRRHMACSGCGQLAWLWLATKWCSRDAHAPCRRIEATLASSSSISTDCLCLWVVQMPRCRDLIGNFCGDNDKWQIKPITLKIDHNLA